jgi:glucokinase
MPGRCAIGIDAGGTKLLCGVVDEDLAVHHRSRRLIGGLDRERLLEAIAEAVLRAREAVPDADAVGIGIPSVIDRGREESVMSVHLPLDGVRFGEAMAGRIGLPLAWDNDANAAMLAEHRSGAAAGASEAAMLTIGTGIGGGLVLGGELYRGSSGGAGELGHTVVDLDGPPCHGDCPNRGCLEVMASGTAIGREGAAVAEAQPDSALAGAAAEGVEITGMLVTELALEGDRAARAVVELVGRRLGVGIASIVNALNPEVVVVGGGAVRAGDLLLEPARAEVAARALRPNRDAVRIEPAAFGEEAGMVGAALMALDLEIGGGG